MSDHTQSDHLRQSALNAGLREAQQKPIRQMLEEKDKEIEWLKSERIAELEARLKAVNEMQQQHNAGLYLKIRQTEDVTADLKAENEELKRQKADLTTKVTQDLVNKLYAAKQMLEEKDAEIAKLEQELALLKYVQACELDGWQSVSRSRDSWRLIALKGQERIAELAELAELVDKAMAVMGTYINVPEALVLRERWEKLKAPVSQESSQSP